MKRWVVAGGLLLVALAVLLVQQLRAPAAAPSAVMEVATHALPPPPPFPAGRNMGNEHEEVEELGAAAPAPASGPPKKLDVKSTEFYQRFYEMLTPRLTKEAADCYHGGKERDQKVKFSFKASIRDGRVTMRDVAMVTSTLNDPALERCMLEKVANFASWKDEEFPDYELDDEVLIRVRVLKKYKQEEDREYFPPTPIVNAP